VLTLLCYSRVFIIRSRISMCSLHHAKLSFFHAFNVSYGKIGRSTSEEIVLSYVKSKCIPCLLYGVISCPINRTDGNSRDFTVGRTLLKIFHATSETILLGCQNYFNFPGITVSLLQRKCKFLTKFAASENIARYFLRSFAQNKLVSLRCLAYIFCN
jgi:hypothetical protein